MPKKDKSKKEKKEKKPKAGAAQPAGSAAAPIDTATSFALGRLYQTHASASGTMTAHLFLGALSAAGAAVEPFAAGQAFERHCAAPPGGGEIVMEAAGFSAAVAGLGEATLRAVAAAPAPVPVAPLAAPEPAPAPPAPAAVPAPPSVAAPPAVSPMTEVLRAAAGSLRGLTSALDAAEKRVLLAGASDAAALAAGRAELRAARASVAADLRVAQNLLEAPAAVHSAGASIVDLLDARRAAKGAHDATAALDVDPPAAAAPPAAVPGAAAAADTDLSPADDIEALAAAMRATAAAPATPRTRGERLEELAAQIAKHQELVAREQHAQAMEHARISALYAQQQARQAHPQPPPGAYFVASQQPQAGYFVPGGAFATAPAGGGYGATLPARFAPPRQPQLGGGFATQPLSHTLSGGFVRTSWVEE